MSDPHDPNMLAACVEGRLDPREQAVVIAHAAECAECRGLMSALARAAGPELPAVAEAVARAPLGRRYLMPLAAAIAIGTVTGVLVLRLNDGPVAPDDQPLPPPAAAPNPAAPSPARERTAPSNPGQPAAPRRRPESIDERLLPRRSGERVVGGKVFRLIAGEWIDGAFDPLAALPVVEVRTPAARNALLDRLPVLRPYAALGAEVTVVQDGTVYRFRKAQRGR